MDPLAELIDITIERSLPNRAINHPSFGSARAKVSPRFIRATVYTNLLLFLPYSESKCLNICEPAS